MLQTGIRAGPTAVRVDIAELDKAIRRGVERLRSLQYPDGHWQGEVRWNTVLLSQWVLVARMIGMPVDERTAARCRTAFERARSATGGYGMHPEAPDQVFPTTLAYLAMRLLGLAPEDSLVRGTRERLRTLGGVLGIPSWGKFWLALLDLWPWDAAPALPLEAFLQPAASPFHPRRWYCHTRLIYLAMAYLQARRVTLLRDPWTAALRQELALSDLPLQAFRDARHRVASTDLHEAPPGMLRGVLDLSDHLLPLLPATLRQHALDEAFDQVLFEVRSTGHACCSPVNGLLSVLVLHDRHHPDLPAAWEGVRYWAYEDDIEGMRFGGAHSHSWDTSFALQALREVPRGIAPGVPEMASRAARWLGEQQVRDEIPAPLRRRHHRDRVCGGWCFSDRRHRWPVSDCTAEALSALLLWHPDLPEAARLPDRWVDEAVAFLHSRQNPDGGFGSYEAARGFVSLWDRLNATEMFGACMTERSYVECTASCLAALGHVRRHRPGGIAAGADGNPVDRGLRFLLRSQRPDGSFQGVWGVCFLYGTWFGIEGLRQGGLPANHPAVRHAVDFLRSMQRPDGAFGEHGDSCRLGRPVPHPEPQAVQTAWALLGLLRGECPEREAMLRAARFLLDRQQPDGSFPRESPSGVFFQTSLMEYGAYRDIFPLWALARLRSRLAPGR